jgi:hypothetical protein
MQLHCEFSTPVARTDLDDYIRHLEISVGCYDEEGLNEYIVGRLAMDQILWSDAIVDGVSRFEICDNDSQGLHEVHTILTKDISGNGNGGWSEAVLVIGRPWPTITGKENARQAPVSRRFQVWGSDGGATRRRQARCD